MNNQHSFLLLHLKYFDIFTVKVDLFSLKFGGNYNQNIVVYYCAYILLTHVWMD